MATRFYDKMKVSNIIKSTNKEWGLISFYWGLWLNILGIIIYKGSAFYFYENILHI